MLRQTARTNPDLGTRHENSHQNTMKSFRFTVPVVFALVLMQAHACRSYASESRAPLVKHNLSVEILPGANSLSARDTITVPDVLGRDIRFRLHQGLNPVCTTPGVTVVREAEERTSVPVESYRVTPAVGVKTFTLTYGGTINHPVRPHGTDRTGGTTATPGTISREGVYLDGSSFWYPHFDDSWVTFSIEATLPDRWDAVSQGERVSMVRKDGETRVQWSSPEPQSEMYLTAGLFTEYAETAGAVEVIVLLRSADDALARKYLNAAKRYLAMYSDLIGPYPYKKFAVVENFWETGFGMPSFTLLGPKVIRFPFILHSSYPHEILHNWWGNGVYADIDTGNWSEGLTAYLSDHLIRAQRSDAEVYRRDTLRRYGDYVSHEKDFPLTDFRARHSSASQAVGYGKALMFFHMLRRELGDEAFIRGLQDFYRDYKFRTASYKDLRNALEKASGLHLKRMFDQWTTRTGAPELRLTGVQGRADGNGYRVTGILEQIQPGKAYALKVPVAVTMEGQAEAHLARVVMGDKRIEFSLKVPHRPLRVDIDPQFDLFRRLAPGETPISLSKTFGSQNVLIVLPSGAEAGLLEAYRELARSWTSAGPDSVEVKLDSEVTRLPSDRAVMVLGWENRFVKDVAAALSSREVKISSEGVTITDRLVPRADHAVALTTEHPGNSDQPLTWVAADNMKPIPGLGRKLPHYGKYGYVAFQGNEPVNVLKGRWPVLGSSLTAFLPGQDGTNSRVKRANLPARRPLAELPKLGNDPRGLDG